MNKPYIYDISAIDFADWLEKHGEAPYRLRQIRQWLTRGCYAPEEMTDLSKGLREKLRESFNFEGLKLLRKAESKLDDTVKYVWELADGNIIESVFMRYKTGTSVCVSSQAGCRMGCRFCASAKSGFGRNLSVGEMIAQAAIIGRDRGCRIDHIVIMGIGEPFENYDHVVHFLRSMNDPKTFNISFRRMTVSTCGLIPQMLKFAEEHMPVTLAVSLHAPNDSLRSQLMPVNRRYPIKDLMEACRQYERISGRRMTFEYAMFKNVNDGVKQAEELADLLEGSLSHVNLIPANDVPGSDLKRSDRQSIERFASVLKSRRIPVTVRRELGADISAACGQLRRTSIR